MTQKNFLSIEDALDSLLESDVKVTALKQVFGGDINEAYQLTLTDHAGDVRHVFIKTNTVENVSFFAAEAAGLDAVCRTEAIRVPKILGIGTYKAGDADKGSKSYKSSGRSFLLMEFVKGAKCVPDYWEVFAEQLAAMHRASTDDFVHGGLFGFVQDNYIGTRRQVNTAYDSWAAFFRDCRLKPQFESASGYFDKTEHKKINKLLEHVDEILVEPEHPSLLHGDLWSGNVITGDDGRAWLIDPASYVGHAEADLAMTELFGGFSGRFYDTYRKTASLQPGYERRRDFYNLYHLLNHLNMFGRTYLSSVKRIIGEYV